MSLSIKCDDKLNKFTYFKLWKQGTQLSPITLCMLGNFACFFLVICGFFQNQLFKKNQEFKMSNSLDLDQARHLVGPDLDPNCLKRLSAGHLWDLLSGMTSYHGHMPTLEDLISLLCYLSHVTCGQFAKGDRRNLV